METSAGQGEGDKINYAFTVTNTGHVTFYNVDVTDSLGGVTANGGRPIDAPLTGSTAVFTLRSARADVDFLALRAEPVGREVVASGSLLTGLPIVGRQRSELAHHIT